MSRGQGNFGVEFVGGTLAQVRFQSPPDVGRIREILAKEAVKEAMIQPYGSAAENQIVARVSDIDMQNVDSVVRQAAGDLDYEIMRVERIGPTVSADLRIKALLAILLSTAGILGYLAWRSDRIFAAAAVIALLHDTLFTVASCPERPGDQAAHHGGALDRLLFNRKQTQAHYLFISKRLDLEAYLLTIKTGILLLLITFSETEPRKISRRLHGP